MDKEFLSGDIVEITEEFNRIEKDDSEYNLILGINKKGNIIKFNKACEKIAGYSENDVINRPLSDILRFQTQQWEKIFEYATKEKVIHDFEIPMITQTGEEIVISWSSFPIGGESKGIIENISLVGRPIISKEILEKYVIDPVKKVKDSIEESDIKNKVLLKFGERRLVLRRKNQKNDDSSVKESKMKASEKSQSKKKEEKTRLPSDKKAEDKKSVIELKKEIQRLGGKNKDLEKKLRNLEHRLTQQKENICIQLKKEGIAKRSLQFLVNLIGVDKKRKEFRHMVEELTSRRHELEHLEADVVLHKQQFNQRLEELREWRKKLELVEEEIDKRRAELTREEKMFDELFYSSMSGVIDYHSIKSSNGSITDETLSSSEEITSDELFDHIKEPAVILLRGKIKKSNESFGNLIGYDNQDLIDKSLVSFVSSEGYPPIEKHYLNRLKGVKTPSYETVFITKNQNKIQVTINSKITHYQGDKAEIAVVTSVEKII